jgi:iron complex outermembrane receptor protein
VEVLYGPQSTLYASNSPGGIVNIVTADPKLDLYQASGTVEYGSYEMLHTEGSLNVPVSGSVAMRAAFNTSVRDGYMENGSDDEDTKSGRLKLLYQPADALSMVLTGEVTKSGGSGYSGIDMFIDEGDLDDPWDNSDEDAPIPRRSDDKKLTARIDWSLGFGDLTVLPSYATNSQYASMDMEDMFTGEPYSQTLDAEGSEKGVELRLASSDDFFFKWIVGYNYYTSEQDELTTPETGLYQKRANDQETHAIFGNVTYPLSDLMRLTAGVRFSKDENSTLFEALMTNPMTGGVDVVHDLAVSEYDAPDYKIGVEYDLNPEAMFYADFSTSYRTMGMTLAAAEPEELKSYTMGVKSRLLDSRLQMNASAYYYDYTNFLADAGLAAPDTGRIDDGSQTNADLVSYGFDLQTKFAISANDRIDFSVSYLKSEFESLVFDYVSEYLEDKSYKNKPQTFAPEWTVTASYNRTFDLSNGGTLTAKLDTRYQSSFLVTYMEEYTSGLGTPNVVQLDLNGYNEQEAHFISNLTAIYVHPGSQWSLSAYVKNIENYAEKKNLMMGTMMIGAPRTYGAVFSVRY